jgi:PcfJ-like protein
MAHSLIQRRQEAERARVEAYRFSLRQVSQRTRPAPDFQNAIDEAARGFERDVLRDACAWKPRLKTRDAGRLRLAAARYLFARYSVAEHLEQIWIDCRGLGADEIVLRKRWYVVAAGGGSLHRAGAGAWLSRKEIHAFLNPQANLGFDEAIWQAIARSYTSDPVVALRIARSRFAQTPRAELGFWREVVRFFCAHPTTVEEMEDLCDYLAHCYRRNREFSLKGRTLTSLGRLMREWHRDLEAIARIEAARRRAEAARNRGRGPMPRPESSSGSWPGSAIADWSWSPSSKVRGKREEYVVAQLRTAVDLVAETRAMRHCVASYATKCMAGQASIWSLRRRVASDSQRLLTIELDRQCRAVQVRGFANRTPHIEERKILERWAKARGIVLP